MPPISREAYAHGGDASCALLCQAQACTPRAVRTSSLAVAVEKEGCVRKLLLICTYLTARRQVIACCSARDCVNDSSIIFIYINKHMYIYLHTYLYTHLYIYNIPYTYVFIYIYNIPDTSIHNIPKRSRQGRSIHLLLSVYVHILSTHYVYK